MFSTELLKEIRAWEIERIVSHFNAGARILEVGAGTGQQALELSSRGFEVEAIDLLDSIYAEIRVFPIKDYDGTTLPFPNGSFDIVFSSNVLEHVADLVRMHSEIRRVLKADGYVVHVLPTHTWRFWTTLSAFPVAIQSAGKVMTQIRFRRPFAREELQRLSSACRQLGHHLTFPFFQRRHGERGNILSENWLFHPSWWRKNFKDNGFLIEQDMPLGLFYTGNLAMGRRWNIGRRTRLAPILGSACHLFVLRNCNTKG